MYLILLLGWVLKLTTPKLTASGAPADTAISLQMVADNAALGPLPGWFVIALIATLHVALAVIALRGRRRADDDEVRV
jgi:uncharacterized membrane protein